jgi:hypothetical protein
MSWEPPNPASITVTREHTGERIDIPVQSIMMVRAGHWLTAESLEDAGGDFLNAKVHLRGDPDAIYCEESFDEVIRRLKYEHRFPGLQLDMWFAASGSDVIDHREYYFVNCFDVEGLAAAADGNAVLKLVAAWMFEEDVQMVDGQPVGPTYLEVANPIDNVRAQGRYWGCRFPEIPLPGGMEPGGLGDLGG